MTHNLPFYKMSGSGNDFVMLDGRTVTAADWPAERIRGLCDRRMGVGADGMVILTPEGGDRVRMDFWNCDGSRADMCGNAALCSTRLAALLHLAPAEEMRLVTGAGTFRTRCQPGPAEMAELNLPDFELQGLPGNLSLCPGETGLGLAMVGVPHLVLEVADLEQPGLMQRGRELRSHAALGPSGANVNFVAPPSDGFPHQWRLRTYERGVEAETLACGTGAVAAAVALVRTEKAALPVSLRMRSGRSLHIRATLSGGKATQVWLSGEGRMIFRGELDPAAFSSSTTLSTIT
jgi:diaminopimelate epimerase